MEQPTHQNDYLEKDHLLIDEKKNMSTARKLRERREHNLKLGWLVCFALFAAIYLWQPIWIKNIYYKSTTEGQVDFEQITPSEKLQWHPCRGNFFCARLTVPMDYNRPLNASKDNPKVHIALLLARGQHSTPDEYSVSPLLLNPGGPGGSGTLLGQLLSSSLQQIVGLDQDIIGFDPRGIQSTTPRLDCFSVTSEPDAQYDFGASNFLEGFNTRISWLLSGTSIGLVNSSSSALPKLDLRDRTVAKLCQEKDSIHGENSIFKHAQTPNVARDMLSIVDAWDEWRDSLNSKNSEPEKPTDQSEKASSGTEYPLDTKGKLVFWGFSYGTLLGATFAAMFPDRVGRLVLDGVVDADYYVEPIWSQSIIDSDAIIKSLPKYCFEGRSKCAFYRPGDDYESVETRFYDAQTKLRANPISYIGPNSHHPFIFTISELQMFFFTALYGPVLLFPWVAEIINAIIMEDYAVLEGLSEFRSQRSFCAVWPESYYPTDSIGIMCGDKRYPLNETIAHLQSRFEEMSSYSSFADVWLTAMMGCEGWLIDPVHPPMRWGKHPTYHGKDKPISTSFPVLFVSNTYDPVTPLMAGVKMAKLFVNSGFLEQESMGHCSISSVSLCSMAKIRAYFREGKVPTHLVLNEGDTLEEGKWERCEVDEWPFHPFEGVTMEGGVDSVEVQEQRMRSASQDMQKVVVDHGFFRFGDRLGVPKFKHY